MSQLKVNTIRHTGASSDAITLASDGSCTVKATNNLSNRNLIINGAMQVAQRGTSSTASGFGTVDRFSLSLSGTDEAPTQAQADVASGTTPYTLGFRKSFKVTNGNQTSGAGASDWAWFKYSLEAQDIANSGWNYTSSSSYVTLSFWIKSSVAQTFKGYLRSRDGTNQTYSFETGSLTADTWTKVTKTIPGNSNIQIDNNNEEGFQINLFAFMGTDYTDNSVTEDAWATYGSGTRMKDNTSTWWTTNDATFEITGLQLEVGDVATDFEHRSYGDELARCHRYFYMHANGSESAAGSGGSGLCPIMSGGWYSSTAFVGAVQFPTRMRTAPSIYKVQGTDYFSVISNNAVDTNDAVSTNRTSTTTASVWIEGNASGTLGHGGMARTHSSSARIGFNSEL
tara:strand:+ start:372 stop:1562 length:1191 start_codon:yes stop_codon:yes gene_type:complete